MTAFGHAASGIEWQHLEAIPDVPINLLELSSGAEASGKSSAVHVVSPTVTASIFRSDRVPPSGVGSDGSGTDRTRAFKLAL